MKILFACVPADGHFNPLTGVAVHLRERGHDVRWYTGPTYAEKLRRLGIPHAPFVRATDVNGENLAERFPEYTKLGSGPKAIAFALEKVFFGNLAAQLDDLRELHGAFPFEAIVFDGAFYAGRLVAEKLGVRAYPMWPAPTPAPVSRQAPPPFFGLRPARSPLGRLRDRLVRTMIAGSSKGGMRILAAVQDAERLPPYRGDLFDIHNDTSARMFAWGAPGLDFERDDWPKNMEFVGALLPHKDPGAADATLPPALEAKLARGAPCVVVSQGTIDNRDPDKLFVPALEAFAGGEHVLVVATGKRHTEALRARFGKHDNVAIEDYVPFSALMPRASVFITNGGAGSVMHALVEGVPLVCAGKLEGKADICARVDWRGLGVDLRTERPKPKALAAAVAKVLAEPGYRERVARVRAELARYDTHAIIERAIVGDRAGAAEAA